jgi:hypothetical protein
MQPSPRPTRVRLEWPKGLLEITRVVRNDGMLKISRHHRCGEQYQAGEGGEEGAHDR